MAPPVTLIVCYKCRRLVFYPVRISSFYSGSIKGYLAVTSLLNHKLMFGKTLHHLLYLGVTELFGDLLCNVTKLDLLEMGDGRGRRHFGGPVLSFRGKLVIQWGH